MRGWKDDEMTKKWRKKRYDDRHSTWQVTMKWRRKLWRHLWEMIKWVIIFSSLFIISSSIVMMKWRRKSVDFKEIVQNDVELLSNLGLFCVELRAFVRIWCSIEEKDAVLRVFFTFFAPGRATPAVQDCRAATLRGYSWSGRGTFVVPHKQHPAGGETER